MRIPLFSSLLLALITAPLQAQCPEEPPLQHWTGAGTTAVPGFVAGEQWGAVFEAPASHYPIEILRIGFGWGSQFGGSPNSLERALLIYSGGLPNPGSPQFTLPGPVLVDGFINEFDISGIPSQPGTDRIINGGPFTVSIELDNNSTLFGPAPVHDGNGCQSTKNVIFAIPGGWNDACSLGVSGDWQIHVVYRRVNCGPGTMNLSVSNLVAGSVASFDVTAGQPATQTFLAYSVTGTGSTNVPQLNVVLGLRKPKQLGPALFSNGSGSVSWNLPIPGNAGGVPVWLQAAQNGLISNVVPEQVQ